MNRNPLRILIAGCGDVGTALALRLLVDGHRVWGLRRQSWRLPGSIQPIQADLTRPETLGNLPEALNVVFYTAAADHLTDAAYRDAYVIGMANLLKSLGQCGQIPPRVIFTSSTAVYAQCHGEEVDEDTPASPQNFSGKRLLEAEQLLIGSSFSATVLRLSGIYGPQRTRIIELVRRGGATCSEGPPVYTNRIHRDDCAGALRHLMSLESPEPLYLGTDHEPATLCEIFCWLADRLKVPPPRAAPLSNSLSGRLSGSKRCRSLRLRASGYVFEFPTFREGYARLLAEGG